MAIIDHCSRYSLRGTIIDRALSNLQGTLVRHLDCRGYKIQRESECETGFLFRSHTQNHPHTLFVLSTSIALAQANAGTLAPVPGVIDSLFTSSIHADHC